MIMAEGIINPLNRLGVPSGAGLGRPAPAAVEKLPHDPDGRIGERISHHLDPTPIRLSRTAELVDHIKGRDPPSRPERPPAHNLRGRLMTNVLEATPLEQRRQFLPERLVVAFADRSEVQRGPRGMGAPHVRQIIAITLWDSLAEAQAGVEAAWAWVDENMSDELEWTDTEFVDVLLSTSFGLSPSSEEPN